MNNIKLEQNYAYLVDPDGWLPGQRLVRTLSFDPTEEIIDGTLYIVLMILPYYLCQY